MSADALLRNIKLRASIYRHARVLSLPFVHEALFRDMLMDGLRAYGIAAPALYPVKSAANYSLLYTLFRAVTETPCTSVLEIGAGQTSRLLDAVVRSRPLRVMSLETDAFWAGKVQSEVAHEVVHCPLRQGGGTEAYSSLDRVKAANGFDLVLVDGPVGRPEKSRYSSIEVLEAVLGDEFLVVFDDAQRPGEQDTIRAFLSGTFMSRKAGLHFGTVMSNKAQFIIATEKFRAATYF